jgi:hypothetical protein
VHSPGKPGGKIGSQLVAQPSELLWITGLKSLLARSAAVPRATAKATFSAPARR